MGCPKRIITRPYKVALGGREIEVKELSVALGNIEGLEFDAEAVPLDEIGRADGYELDAIIGALTMEIKIDPKNQKLDLEGLRHREFTDCLVKIYHTEPGSSNVRIYGLGVVQDFFKEEKVRHREHSSRGRENS